MREMREVTLYQITATEMMAGDYVEIVRMDPARGLRFSAREAMLPIDDCVTVERLPVHCITRCDQIAGFPEQRRYTEKYIAIEPRLRKMLELPFEEIAHDAKRKLVAEMERRNFTLQRVAEFNAQPWWRRAWQAAKNGITNYQN